MMKSTGIVRKVDELGRVVLPVELRRHFDIDIKDPIEFFVDGGRIIIQKYAPACVFCGNADKVRMYKMKLVCENCLREMNQDIFVAGKW